MMPELLILRHGKSNWPSDAEDFHRPLKERGKRDAQRVGSWLRTQDLMPDHVLTSPAQRALATAEYAMKAMDAGLHLIEQDRRIYDADLGELLEVLRQLPDSVNRGMIVGHNPGLESLLDYLAESGRPQEQDSKRLPTATLARLTLGCEWSAIDWNCARLTSIIHPEDLPDKFPFTGPSGIELRDRPAYYYTQSSVIPYRIRNGELEILVVFSRKKKHLVVPKGIQEPDLTAWDSAAQEALEEAGVEGRVGKEPLGNYVYQKWGAECQVVVFPMEVTKILPEELWQERHRGRKWISPGQAMNSLKQTALVPLVKRLVEQLGRE